MNNHFQTGHLGAALQDILLAFSRDRRIVNKLSSVSKARTGRCLLICYDEFRLVNSVGSAASLDRVAL